MTTAKKVSGTASSMPMGIVLGVVLSLAVTCVLAALLAWLVLSGRIDEKIIGYCTMGMLLLASIIGALVAAIRIKRRWMLVCCITGVAYFLCLLIINALFFGGCYQGVTVMGTLVMIGTLVAGMLGLRSAERGEKNYKKYGAC